MIFVLNKFEYLAEMYKKKSKIQKLTSEEVENLDAFLNTKEMESVVKNQLLMKTPA